MRFAPNGRTGCSYLLGENAVKRQRAEEQRRYDISGILQRAIVRVGRTCATATARCAQREIQKPQVVGGVFAYFLRWSRKWAAGGRDRASAALWAFAARRTAARRRFASKRRNRLTLHFRVERSETTASRGAETIRHFGDSAACIVRAGRTCATAAVRAAQREIQKPQVVGGVFACFLRWSRKQAAGGRDRASTA